MFYVLVYGLGGLYLLLMSFNLLHKSYMLTWNAPRRTALRVIAGGLLILAGYYGWLTWFLSTPEGKQHQELQWRLQHPDGR